MRAQANARAPSAERPPGGPAPGDGDGGRAAGMAPPGERIGMV